MKSRSGFSLVEGLLIVLILSVVGFSGWYVWGRQKDNQQEPQKEIVATTENNTDQKVSEIEEDETPKNAFIIPEGWTEFIDESKSISFYYPKNWDSWGQDYPGWTTWHESNDFIVTWDDVDESLLAPMGGGGGGGRNIYDAANDRWLSLDSNQNTVAEGTISDYLTQEKFDSSQYKIAHGPTSEGGGISYYFLVTNGIYSYQIVFPSISEEFDSDSAGKWQEQKDSANKIINSLKFL